MIITDGTESSNLIIILKMAEAGGQSKLESSRSSFLERFKGKTNKVSKNGVNQVLLKGSIQDIETQLYQLKIPQDVVSPKKLPSRGNIKIERAPSRGSQRSNSLEKVRKTRRDSVPVMSRQIMDPNLKKCPSGKLPAIASSRQITSSQELMPQPSVDSDLRKKFLSQELSLIERKTSKNGSKYSNWKYPAKLNENALRFFEFSEGERTILTSRKSNS